MGRKRKVECPHCGEINDVDVDAELARLGTVVRRMGPGDNPNTPKFIVVTCDFCVKPIKIKVASD